MQDALLAYRLVSAFSGTAGEAGGGDGGARTGSAGRAGSASTQAYDYAKARLLDGRYAPGTLLSENELAKRLGISRTPVREAFLQLEVEGLLELYPRRGALVTPISPSEADDVLEARLLIERHCVSQVADQGEPLADMLRESIAEQRRCIDLDDPGFAVLDRRFHRLIVLANGNDVLTRVYDALRDRQQRITATAASRDRDRVVMFISEHDQIAEAIARSDADAAVEVVSAHLRRATDLVRRSRR